jgi:glycerophosphoryl diester phosphodiesterase
MLPLRSGTALLIGATLLFMFSLTGGAQAHGRDHAKDAPTIYGHRGASGYRPEHTLASYRLAARMGADYIEPDLVLTKDHVLVARHEPAIGGTTDVADHPEFADRRKTKVIDGTTFAMEWFTEDFTLAELKTLRAKERLPAVRQRNTIYDGRYEVPTFQEVIELRDRLSRELHRKVGLIPELKHSTYFRSIGLPLEEPFVKQLRANRLDSRRAKVTVQSFEIDNLKRLDRQLPGVPLVQLFDAKTRKPGDVLAAGGTTTYGDMATPSGLRAVARYADIAGPAKDYIVPRDATGASLPPTTFVADAHAAGLDVVPYTFRNENQFLPLELRRGTDPNAYGNAIAEYQQFFALGVDGLFSDNPDTAKAARDDE